MVIEAFVSLFVSGNLKITDFGLSTVFRYKDKERKLERCCGTPPYVAPEVSLFMLRIVSINIITKIIMLKLTQQQGNYSVLNSTCNRSTINGLHK